MHINLASILPTDTAEDYGLLENSKAHNSKAGEMIQL